MPRFGVTSSPALTRVLCERMFGLNPQQAEAVDHGDGPLLVLAGAGAGETGTLATG